MTNKMVMKRLEQIDTELTDAIDNLRALNLDTADDLDKLEIIRTLQEADDLIFELQQAIPTL